MLTPLQKLALVCVPVSLAISSVAITAMVSVDTSPLVTERDAAAMTKNQAAQSTPQVSPPPTAVAQPEKLPARETVSPMTAATQAFQQGEAAQFAGQAESALVHYSQALAVAQAEGHQQFESAIRHRVAQTYAAAHDRGRAREFYEDAIALARETHNHYVLGEALANLAALNEMEGNPKQALANYQESLPKVQAVGNQPIEQQVIARISAIQQQQAKAKQQAIAVANKTKAKKASPQETKIATVKAVARSVVN